MSAKPRFPLYLASSSPRRRQLMTRAGIPFELLIAPVDEEALTANFTGSLEGLGQYLATAKAIEARSVLVRQGKWGRILTADTTVLLDGQSLAKPRDLQEAAEMLAALRNREHIVTTGVALANEMGCVKAATSRTRVHMRNYSDAEIARYVATGDPLDKRARTRFSIQTSSRWNEFSAAISASWACPCAWYLHCCSDPKCRRPASAPGQLCALLPSPRLTRAYCRE